MYVGFIHVSTKSLRRPASCWVSLLRVGAKAHSTCPPGGSSPMGSLTLTQTHPDWQHWASGTRSGRPVPGARRRAAEWAPVGAAAGDPCSRSRGSSDLRTPASCPPGRGPFAFGVELGLERSDWRSAEEAGVRGRVGGCEGVAGWVRGRGRVGVRGGVAVWVGARAWPGLRGPWGPFGLGPAHHGRCRLVLVPGPEPPQPGLRLPAPRLRGPLLCWLLRGLVCVDLGAGEAAAFPPPGWRPPLGHPRAVTAGVYLGSGPALPPPHRFAVKIFYCLRHSGEGGLRSPVGGQGPRFAPAADTEPPSVLSRGEGTERWPCRAPHRTDPCLLPSCGLPGGGGCLGGGEAQWGRRAVIWAPRGPRGDNRSHFGHWHPVGGSWGSTYPVVHATGLSCRECSCPRCQ